jgi:hypothetical protein
MRLRGVGPPTLSLSGIFVKRILLFLVASFFAPSISADAQAVDKVYCAQLSAFYRKYVQNTSRRVDVEALAALDDCQKGNAATAIPVLEDRLRRGGFSLPKEFTP